MWAMYNDVVCRKHVVCRRPRSYPSVPQSKYGTMFPQNPQLTGSQHCWASGLWNDNDTLQTSRWALDPLLLALWWVQDRKMSFHLLVSFCIKSECYQKQLSWDQIECRNPGIPLKYSHPNFNHALLCLASEPRLVGQVLPPADSV